MFHNAFCRFHHILGEDGVAFRTVIDKNMSHGSNKLTVLNYRTTTQECVSIGPTFFITLIIFKFSPKRKETAPSRHAFFV